MSKSLIVDTHRFIEELSSGGFTRDQAETLTRALQRSELDHLVTKSDLLTGLKDQELRLVKWTATLIGIGVALLALLIEFRL